MSGGAIDPIQRGPGASDSDTLRVVISTDSPAGFVTAPSAYTDRSVALTAGATAQDLMPASATRKFLLIQNPSAATESIFVNFGITAVVGYPSIEIFPGATLFLTGNECPSARVSVIATTISHQIVAKEV